MLNENAGVSTFAFYESVLRRPKMYTMGGTLEECIAFLRGHYGGIAKLRPSAPDVVEWGYFREWLAKQLGVGQSDAFVTFRERYGSGDEAVGQLLAMAGRFRAIK